jgi:uncharacterized protein YebE (UPF0316 family)
MTDSLLRLFVDVAGLSLLACLSVSLWTLRVTIAAAGRKVAAAGVAGVESLMFVLAFGTVLSSLQDPVRIAAYAVGVAGGTLLGMVVDERLSNGRALVRLVVDGSGVEETTRLREHGWPATRAAADGVHGAVAILAVAVDERALGRLNHDLDQVAPDAFRTVERLRDVRTTALPPSMHQPHGHSPRAAHR